MLGPNERPGNMLLFPHVCSHGFYDEERISLGLVVKIISLHIRKAGTRYSLCKRDGIIYIEWGQADSGCLVVALEAEQQERERVPAGELLYS